MVDGFPPSLKGGQTHKLKELYEKAGINVNETRTGVRLDEARHDFKSESTLIPSRLLSFSNFWSNESACGHSILAPSDIPGRPIVLNVTGMAIPHQFRWLANFSLDLPLSYSLSLIAPVAGIAVKETGQYLILILYVGWILIIIGAGLLTTLRVDSSISRAVCFQVVISSGVGMGCVAIVFPILASIQVTQTIPAMAIYVFSRNFGCVSPSRVFHYDCLFLYYLIVGRTST